MTRTLLAVSMIGAVTFSAVAAHAEGQTAGAEPIGTAGFTMPTVSPNWTPTAEGAIGPATDPQCRLRQRHHADAQQRRQLAGPKPSRATPTT